MVGGSLCTAALYVCDARIPLTAPRQAARVHFAQLAATTTAKRAEPYSFSRLNRNSGTVRTASMIGRQNQGV